MTSIEEELAKKVRELENLQQSFDEYLESSKDLESELEKSLSEAEAKLASSENKRRIAEEKLKSVQEQCSYLEKSHSNAHDELSKIQAKLEVLEKLKVKYEIENEDLLNQIRVFQSNEDSLLHKIAKLEEDVVLSGSELESVQIASKENERKLLDQIEDLVSKVSCNVDVTGTSVPISSSSNHTLDSLIVPNSTNIALVNSNAQNIDTKEYVRVLEDDFVAKRKVTAALTQDDPEVLRTELINLWDKYEYQKSHNIKLVYKLQSLRGNIQVCCRSRPALDHELSAGAQIIVDPTDDAELLCFDAKTEFWKPFVFDRVWPLNATQADVFCDMEPLVLSVLDGYNACIMAYGQTGSGKTFTMEGDGIQLGVNYRSVLKIFEVLETRKVEAEALQRKIRAGAANQQKISIYSSNRNKTSAANVIVIPSETVDKSNADYTAKTASDNNIVVEDNNNDGNDISNDKSLGASNKPDKSGAEDDGEVIATKLENEDITINEEDDFQFTVEISMLEIYNEQVFDLLCDATGNNNNNNSNGNGSNNTSFYNNNSSDNNNNNNTNALDIRQAPDGSVSVPGLHQVKVQSAAEAIAVFQQGARQRATAATILNEHSSRSHLVIQIDVTTVSLSSASTLRGKLLLVDLAGSERVSKSGVTGTAMKEAQFINKSLLALGDVMEALDQKQKYVPYRNSKLTFLLQNALGGNSKTALLVTLCPTQTTAEETLFTLHFASRVRHISLGAAVKYSNSKNLEVAVKNLRIEVKELRRKKQQVEDLLAEAKKDAKKGSDKQSQVSESKLRSLEESKRAAELLVQQLSRQLHESERKQVEEHNKAEKLHADWDLTQKNMKKALDQIKELLQEKERLTATLSSRERELESVQAALLRHMSEATSDNHHATHDHKGEKVRVSFTFDESAITTSNSAAPSSPPTKSPVNLASPSVSTPIVSQSPLSPSPSPSRRQMRSRFLALSHDTVSSKAKIIQPSPRHPSPKPVASGTSLNSNHNTVQQRPRRESFPLTAQSQQNRSLVRQAVAPTVSQSLIKPPKTPPRPSTATNSGSTPVTSSAAKRHILTTPSKATVSKQENVHSSAIKSNNSRSLTPTMLHKQASSSTSTPNPTKDSAIASHSSSSKRSLTPTYVPFSSPTSNSTSSNSNNPAIVIRDPANNIASSQLTKRVQAMSNRTEDALRRHQERMMSKRRDVPSSSNGI